jgi:glutamine synthetase
MSVKDVVKLIEENEVRFIDLRFTDTKGKQQHVSVPARVLLEDPEEWFENGQAFDGSSIGGWKGIQASDMTLKPDAATAYIDPFYDDATVVLTCDVIDPANGQGYDRDPRSIAKRAEAYLKSSGMGDTAFFGPEPEFFVFDGIEWETTMQGTRYKIHSEEAAWSSGESYDGQNTGHRPFVKGGYFPSCSRGFRPRFALCLREYSGRNRHSGGSAPPRSGHCRPNGNRHPLQHPHRARRLDARHEICDPKRGAQFRQNRHLYAQTDYGRQRLGHARAPIHLERRPKPVCGRRLCRFVGNGACTTSAASSSTPKRLNAITNPSTNSYKRLVPHFEAPTKLAYSAKNRSASIRIPHVASSKARRIEARFPDPMANPYLCFAALLMAGLDGIQNKIHPGDPADKNLYDLPPEEDALVPTVCASLEEALEALKADHDFLTRGGVFSQDWINSYIAFKEEDVRRIRMAPHPLEFEMYYSL